MKTHQIFLVMLIFPLAVFAQQDTLHKDYKNYFGYGLALGKGSNDQGFSKGYIYWQRKNNYISFGSSSVDEGGFMFMDEPIPTTSDLYILIGKSLTANKYLNFRFGAGIAYVEDVSRGKFLYNTCKSMFCLLDRNIYEIVKKRSIGFPIEVNTNLYVSRRFALTMGFNANINVANSFYGLSLGLMGGRLRNKIIIKRNN